MEAASSVITLGILSKQPDYITFVRINLLGFYAEYHFLGSLKSM